MNTNYTREIVVSSTSLEAYKALTTGFEKWWTTGCNLISKTGDKITFNFGPSYWVMRANNLVPEKLVELECVEAHHVHDGLPSTIRNEWKGSKVIWEIHTQEEKTKIELKKIKDEYKVFVKQIEKNRKTKKELKEIINENNK